VEGYRLAWEFYLLSPQPSDATPRYDNRAAQALGKIGNTASIITLLHCYRLTCRPGVFLDSSLRSHQRMLLGALAYFRNETGMRAILECVSLSGRQQAQAGPNPEKWDVEDEIVHLLASPFAVDEPARWRQVVASFPRRGLSPEQARVLDRIARGEWVPNP
jgi:hypothetical protein